MFEKWWDELEMKVSKIPSGSESGTESKRSDRDILYEILEITRIMARNVEQSSVPELLKLRALLKMDVVELQFPDDVLVALDNANITDLAGLCTKTEEEMKALKNVNSRVFALLRRKLNAIGLEFGMGHDKIVLNPPY
jgi:DNA-directed RNA polymerase alpha subunit